MTYSVPGIYVLLLHEDISEHHFWFFYLVQLIRTTNLTKHENQCHQFKVLQSGFKFLVQTFILFFFMYFVRLLYIYWLHQRSKSRLPFRRNLGFQLILPSDDVNIVISELSIFFGWLCKNCKKTSPNSQCI